MKRFSDMAIEIINELHTERIDYNSEYIPLIDAANRLREYEDTGVEPLRPTDIVEPTKTWCPSGSYSGNHQDKHRGMFTKDRAKNRSKTFPGIAKAMAEQWAGCCGCPISSRAVDDLEQIRPYEPSVVKAAWNIFGKSYEYRQKYNAYKESRKKNEAEISHEQV